MPNDQVSLGVASGPAEPSQRHKGWVEEYLVIPKLLYVGLNLTLYAVHAYGTEFFRRQWNISLGKVGYISSLSAFNFVGSIFWANMADRTGRYRLILVACTAAYAGLMFALNIRVGTESMAGKIAFTTGCFGLAQFFGSALFPLVDNQVISMMAADPRLSKDAFGRQRLWGTVAHGAVTLLSNQANKWYLALRGDSPFLTKYFGDYLGMFLVLVLCAAGFMATIALSIPKDLPVLVEAPMGESGSDNGAKVANEKAKLAEEGLVVAEATGLAEKAEAAAEKARPVSKWGQGPTIRLLSIPAFLFFMLVILVAGMVRAAMSFFQAYFIIALRDGAQSGKDQAAYTALTRLLSEIGVYFWGKQLLRAIGPHWMLIGSMGAGILRMIGYASMPTQGAGSWIAPYFLELLKGLSSGLFCSSAIRLASDMAPQGCSNTAQGLVSGNYSGLSMAMGGLLGGLIVSFYPSTPAGERQGMQTMFYVIAGSAAAFLVLFIAKYSVIDRVIFTRCQRRPEVSSAA